MDILRSIVRWGLAFGIGATVGFWIFTATTNATIANRDTTKNWLVQSGVYGTAMNMVKLQLGTTTSSTLLTSEVLQESLTKTFDAAYLEQSANTILDATYDWLEGKKQTISFTINLQDMNDELSANLATAITPKLEALPRCSPTLRNTDSNNIVCVPNGVKASDYAKQLTQLSGDKSFLGTITEKTFANGFPQLSWLPSTVQGAKTLLIALPIAALVMAALYVLASPDKIRGLSHVGRQLTMSATITLVGGLFLWYSSTAIDLSGLIESNGTLKAEDVAAVINPLARTVLPDIGRALSLYSGIVVAVGGTVWLGAFIWRHRANKHVPLKPAAPNPAEPTSEKPEELELPPPAPKTKV